MSNKELEKLLPRCQGRDDHDFPDLDDGERCYGCQMWDAIDSYTQAKVLEARIEECSTLGNYLLDERMNAWDAIHRREQEIATLQAEKDKL